MASKCKNGIVCSDCGNRKRPKSFRRIEGGGIARQCKQCQWKQPYVRYRLRDGYLKELGYKSYKEYLKSDMWRKIRNEILVRDMCRCKMCGKNATNVHHQRYTRGVLVGKSAKHLISLCEPCHKKAEFKSDGTKRDVTAVSNFVNRKIAIAH
jgi:hypothetical protein